MKLWPFNVRYSLLVSFVGMGLLVIVASLVGIFSFTKLNSAMDQVARTSLPNMIAAFKLAQQSEGTVSSAPVVVAATTQSQRQTANLRVLGQLARLKQLIAELQHSGGIPEEIMARVGEEEKAISSTFTRLNEAVTERIDFSQRKANFLDQLVEFRTTLGAEFASGSLEAGAGGISFRRYNGAMDIALDTLIAATQAEEVFAVDKLEQTYHEAVLAAEAQLAKMPVSLAAELKPNWERIRTLGEGEQNLLLTRRGELTTEKAISGLLSSYALHSQRLVFSVSELILQQEKSIEEARVESLAVSRTQSNVLWGLVGLCVAVAAFVVFFVVQTIIRRLDHLRESMVTGAAGETVEIDTAGGDEIADMGRALEDFITARDDAELNLRTARDEAELANLAKTRFLAAASHDLRQPLQALSLFIIALKNHDLSDKSRGIVGKLEASLDSLRSLFDSLLDISKLDAGVVVPDVRSFHLDNLLQRLAGEFEPLVALRGIELKVVATGAAAATDSSLLEIILRNLLANAVRYTEKGRILMGCRRRKGRVVIEVWDTGEGIPSNQLEEIFHEFHQLESPKRDPGQGLGLGLAIVQRTAKLLGLQIAVRSRLGKGSVFSVEVPLGKGLGLEAEEAGLRSDGAGDLSGRAILVVDDDASVREGLEALLASWGSRVLTAKSTSDALSQVKDGTFIPDAIVCDYRLGDRSTGDQTIKRLREVLDRKVPALLITGDTGPDRLRRARSSGLPLLHKPVAAGKLYATLEAILEVIP